VELLAEEWFGAWKFPIVTVDEKLMLTDDLAGVIVRFGIERASVAMNHHRDYALKNRPTIGDLVSICASEQRSTQQPRDAKEIDQHYALRDKAPTHIIGVNACMVIGVQLGTERKARRNTPNPMTDAEYEQKKAELIAEAYRQQSKEYDEARAAL
jgi:hypothetical protein